MKALTRVIRPWVVVCLFLLPMAPALAKAQCVSNPASETAVGVMNSSNYFITFYIDGVNKGGVPAEARTIDFIVSPGEHLLMAETVIGSETLSATRTVVIPAGSVCTWTVTNPQKIPARAVTPLVDFLARAAVISLAVPN